MMWGNFLGHLRLGVAQELPDSHSGWRFGKEAGLGSTQTMSGPTGHVKVVSSCVASVI